MKRLVQRVNRCATMPHFFEGDWRKMDVSNPKINMLNQQIRTQGVNDDRVTEAIRAIPREEFVPVSYRNVAYADMMIPLSYGESMLTPEVEGRVLQALALRGSEHVLEIGTGSGYFSALLGRLAKSVLSVDLYRDFSDMAALKMIEHRIFNVKFATGDASRGWDSATPFDVIVVTGSLPFLPPEFMRALKVGGRLVGILGDAPSMTVTLIQKGPSQPIVTSLFETVVPPLKNALHPTRFQF